MAGLLALLAAVAYGASDFLAGVAARRVPVLRATTATYLVGTAALAVVTVLVPAVITPRGLLAGAAAGFFAAIGLLTFYAVLASGPMGILSPAIAVLQAGVPVGVGAAMGERLGGGGWAGIALALVATALLGSSGGDGAEGGHGEVAGRGGAAVPGPARAAATPEGVGSPAPAAGSHWSARVVVMTLVSGLGLGLSVVALDLAPADSGLVPALVDLVVGLVMLGAFELLARRFVGAARLARVLDGEAAADRERGVRLPGAAVGAGLLMAAAQGLLIVALQTGDLAVVAALLGTYPLATVVLARVVLREHFGPRTGVGVVAAIGAAVLLAVG